MPIEAEFNFFGSEADFTSRFLVPLLRRLGFSVVADYHGKQEFGKDLVFGEIDRFGEVAYHGLQAKYQASISQTDSEGLIEDCKQAFRLPFRHPNTGGEHRISTFIVASAGSIADNARANFFAAATLLEHSGNLRMFDGKALLAQDRWATMTRVEQVGETIAGLLIELEFNRKTLPIMIDSAKNFMQQQKLLPIERFRSSAVSRYVVRPVLANMIDCDLANEYWFLADGINAVLNSLALPLLPEGLIAAVKQALELIEVFAGHDKKLTWQVMKARSTLGPLAAL
jgi:hypothetical protein